MRNRDAQNRHVIGARAACLLAASFLAAACAYSMGSSAENEDLFAVGAVGNPHVATIETELVNGHICPVGVDPSNRCRTNPSALCAKSQQNVRFQADDGRPFKIVWKGDNPMEWCRSVGGSAELCKIANVTAPPGQTEIEYDYGVERKECPALDPRIIVKI